MLRSRYRKKCWRFTSSGDPRRFSAPAVSRKHSTRRHTSTTSTKASHPSAHINPTRRSHKPFMPARKAFAVSRPRLAPGSGDRRWPWPARCSTWSVKFIWSTFPTSRNLTGASSWKPLARASRPAPLPKQPTGALCSNKIPRALARWASLSQRRSSVPRLLTAS